MKMRGKAPLLAFGIAVFFGLLFVSPEAVIRAETGGDAAQLLEEGDRCRRALLRSPAKKKYRHNWMNCIKNYERIFTKYPKSEKAPWALYHAARLYEGLYSYSRSSKHLDKSIHLFKQLVENYPDHRLADDGQYLIGECHYKYRKDYTKAYMEYLKVDIRFPSGDMRPKAQKRLDEIAAGLIPEENVRVASTREPANGGSPAKVQDIRHWSTPSYTRVVVDLDSPVKYTHHLLKPDPDREKPRRLYLDLQDARVSSQIDQAVPIGDGLLQRARAAQHTKKTVRVVLDMEQVGGYKVFHLHEPFRIVTDVQRADKVPSRKEPPGRGPEKGLSGVGPAEPTQSLATQLGLNVKKIVIDPGHGGKDPGCYVGNGIMEKDIVLDLGKILARAIRENIGCEVVLTREKDEFLTLEQRTAIANMEKADLFISLHVNAHKSRRIWGLETYFLNMATDERAVMVAARENATSEKNISDLQAILNDLMLNTKIHESSRLAHAIQNGLVSGIKKRYEMVKSLGVKQAPFYVLIGAQMPAVLIEAGFLTNPMEKKRLLSATYRRSVADGIISGIASYMETINRVYQGG